METKILVGILLAIGLIISIGIVVAHGTSNVQKNYTMSKMIDMDTENGMDHMSMMGMGTNMHGEMIEEMEEMMNDKDFENEMIEHMKDCPMMK